MAARDITIMSTESNGLIYANDNDNDNEIPINDADWDDSILLKMYDQAVNSHHTISSNKSKHKNYNSNKKSKVNNNQNSNVSKEQYLNESLISEWVPTDSFPKNSKKTNEIVNKNVEEGEIIEENVINKSNSVIINNDINNVNICSNELLESALNDMLQAWYQSGYTTGRYQTLLQFSNNNNK